MTWATICPQCNLPDPYDGQGDGVGSCDCPGCEDCGLIEMDCRCGETNDHWYWGGDEW